MTFKLTDTTSYASAGDVELTYITNADRSNQDVTMVYPTAETSYAVTRATIPPGSKFTVGAHWHEEYDELMFVVKGRARIRLGNTWKVFTAEDGEIRIPKFVIHDISRADINAKPGEEDEDDVIIEEKSDPVDGSKELFFRTMFSVIDDKAAFGWKLPLQQILVLIYTDGYLSFVPGRAGWYFTHGLYAVLKPMAALLGLKPFYDEYTPKRLEGIRRELEGHVQSKTT